jgi:hypothetical protein
MPPQTNRRISIEGVDVATLLLRLHTLAHETLRTTNGLDINVFTILVRSVGNKGTIASIPGLSGINLSIRDRTMDSKPLDDLLGSGSTESLVESLRSHP